MTRPIFICGALRSGSTLTHIILGNHADINSVGEFDFLFDQISNDGIFPDIDNYHKWLSTHRIFHSKLLKVNDLLNYSELIDSFISQLERDECVLMLNIHRSFDRIPFLFKKARFIHLIRDPRDVARSSIGMGWAGNVYYGIDHWVESEKAWASLQEIITEKQCLELRYEELILAPQAVLQKVCKFIGIPYSETMLDFGVNSSYSEPDPSLVNQWQRKCSIREIQYIESKAQHLMKSLDYKLSGYPLLKIGMLERLRLKVTNKLFKVRFAIKRYGLSLYCKEYFSRFLGWELINKSCRLKKNDIDKQYLK